MLYACLFKHWRENAALFMEAESTQSTETYIKILAWFHANRKMLMIGAGVAAVLAVVGGIMAWQKSEAESSADARLMGLPLATLRDGRVAPAPAGTFLDLAKQYPDTTAGEYASLLGAESFFMDGKYPEAHQGFSKFIEDHPASALLPQAKVGLAASLEGEGKISEAAQKYQEILSAYPNEANIVSPAKLTLARLDEAQNKLEQALSYYSELARGNNPYDPWAAEARERGEILLVNHPELRKAPPAATANPAAPLISPVSGRAPAPATAKPSP
jgi:predicted negative regulator of RcsB-dependent stress response